MITARKLLLVGTVLVGLLGGTGPTLAALEDGCIRQLGPNL
jgi:hypothetical protein